MCVFRGLHRQAVVFARCWWFSATSARDFRRDADAYDSFSVVSFTPI